MVFSLTEALHLAAEFEFLSLCKKKKIMINNNPGATWCSLFPNGRSLCIKAGSAHKKKCMDSGDTHFKGDVGGATSHVAAHAYS